MKLLGRSQTDLVENGGSVPCPRATQLSLSHILPKPQQRGATRRWMGRATRSLENGASESPIRR